jgi:hypothetical protein
MKLALSIFSFALLAARAPQQEAQDVKPGLIGEYFSFDSAIQDFPNVAADQKPVLRRIDKQINWEATPDKFAGTELSDHFYVRWTGILRLSKSMRITFYTESDDGSRLYIDGKQIIDNGGLHSMEEKSGDPLDLAAGDHEIRVDLFENEGDVGIKLSWEPAGQAKEIMPETLFYHRKDKDLDR